MKKIIIPLIIFMCSCITKKNVLDQYTFKSVIKTCILDSTSFTNSETLKIICSEKTINSDCPEKHPSYVYPLTWPSGLNMNLNSKKYMFYYSPIANDKELNFTDLKFKMTWNTDQGKINVDKKKNTITFKSTKYKWTRTFSIVYLSKDSLELNAVKTATNST